MSEEEKAPKSNDDDAFEELMKNQPEDDPEIETLWDGVQVLWKAMNQEGVLVKGLLLLEYVDHRGKVLKWESSPDLAPWDLLGMLGQAMNDLQADSMAEAIVGAIVHDSEDDDDDVEDDQ